MGRTACTSACKRVHFNFTLHLSECLLIVSLGQVKNKTDYQICEKFKSQR